MVKLFVSFFTRPIVRQYAVVIAGESSFQSAEGTDVDDDGEDGDEPNTTLKNVTVVRGEDLPQDAPVRNAFNLWVLALGLGLAWSSPVIVKLKDPKQSILPQPITDEEGSWIVSVGFLLSTVAILLPAFLVDIIGRKYCIILGCIPKVTGILLFIFASKVWMVILGRAFNSLADVFIMTIVPMYASEIGSKQVRGSLGTIFQIFCSLGILIMLAMGPFISYVHLNIAFLSVVIVAVIPVLFLPDTPYFLHSRGKTDEALKVLTFLRGSEEVAAEEIQEFFSLSTNEDQVDKKKLFKNKVFLKGLVLVIIIGAGGQLVGYNAVTFYLQSILESTQTNLRDDVGSVIIGGIQLLGALITVLISDRFGRKPILSTTFIGMSFGMIGLGAFFMMKEHQGKVSGFMNMLPLICLIAVVLCYSAGFGSLYWIVISELFEGQGRGIGVSVSVQTTNLFLFLTTKYFTALTNGVGPVWTYWTFGVICMLFCLFILFCVPETKGKTFAEIQIALGAKGNLIDAKEASIKDTSNNDTKGKSIKV